MARGLIFATLLVVCGLVVASWVFGRDESFPRPAKDLPAAEAPAARQTVVALGKIVPGRGVIGVAGPAGERLIELRVKSGDVVSRGDVLALFESVPIRTAEVAAAQARLDDAEAQRTRLHENAAAQEDRFAAEREALDATRDLAGKASAVQVDALRLAADDARGVLERLEKLKGTAAVSDREVAAQSLLVKKTASELKAAEVAAEKTEVEHRLGVRQLELQREAAIRTTEQTIAALSPGSLAAAKAVAEAGRDRGIVKAPVDGTVLDIPAQVGEAPMGAFLRMAETGELAVLAEVYEDDVRYVAAGQTATIAGDALARPLRGVVERVSRTIRPNNVFSLDPAARTDSRVVEVRIRLEEAAGADAGALIDLQVEATIDTGPIRPGATRNAAPPDNNASPAKGTPPAARKSAA